MPPRRPVGFDAGVLTITTRRQAESVMLTAAALIAIASAFRPFWHHAYRTTSSIGPEFGWLVTWLGQVGATALVVLIAALTVVSRRRQRGDLLVAATFAVAVTVVELSVIHETVREANMVFGGWAAPGTGSRWLLMAALLLLVPHLQRPTFSWVRPWLERWH